MNLLFIFFKTIIKKYNFNIKKPITLKMVNLVIEEMDIFKNKTCDFNVKKYCYMIKRLNINISSFLIKD